MKFLSETTTTEFSGKRVLVRLDLNVPIEHDGSIKAIHADRIKKSEKTIDFLKTAGAKIIIVSHIGREPHESLKPIADYMKIPLLPLDTDSSVITEPMVMFENVRQDPREIANDESFAQQLAAHMDFYVNDAFAVSHRAHASIVGIPKLLSSFAGFQLEEEIKNLSKVFDAPHPNILVLGGAKFETKLPLIEKFLPSMDTIIIGGALANDFYKERGYEIGKSVIDPTAKISHIVRHEKIKIPERVIVENDKGKIEKSIDEVTYEDKIVDSAPSGLQLFASLFASAQFIVWNGPMGNYENGFIEGTKKIAELIASGSAQSVVGGGDSEALIEQLGMQDKFSFISTGGGAMLEYLIQGTLPGIDALS